MTNVENTLMFLLSCCVCTAVAAWHNSQSRKLSNKNFRMDPWTVDDQVAGEQLSCHDTSHEGYHHIKVSGSGGVDLAKPSNPWSNDNPPLEEDSIIQLPAKDSIDKSCLSFEDHFQPPVESFTKLPDSAEYLASLEKKLKSVQSGGKNLSSGNILRSLEETRESYMLQLLRDPQSLEAEVQFDELTVNPILKKLAPEKQAVALEELVHLVKADQLSLILESENTNTNQDTTEEDLTLIPGDKKIE